MNCRTFYHRHVAFVDDTISGAERTEMEQHLRACVPCSDYDSRVRRSLLLVRNMPPIEPSPGFRNRLRRRLLAAAFLPEQPRAMARGRWAAAAAVLLAAGYLAYDTIGRDVSPLVHPPVVASVPEPAPSLAAPPVLAMPAVMASFSTGFSLWPAALVADQASDYFVHAAFSADDLTR